MILKRKKKKKVMQDPVNCNLRPKTGEFFSIKTFNITTGESDEEKDSFDFYFVLSFAMKRSRII